MSPHLREVGVRVGVTTPAHFRLLPEPARCPQIKLGLILILPPGICRSS